MKTQEKIKLIETKIQEIKSTLALWNQDLNKHSLTLKSLTIQLNTIKKQANINKK